MSARALSFLAATALLCACGGAAREAGPAAGATPSRPPNVLMLVSDDQGLELGCYGAPGLQTPHLDRLAGAGLRFTRAYATVAICTPSRTSLYTGLYPARNGAFGFDAVRDDVPVWGELLSEAGYRTGLIGKLGAKPIARFPFDFIARTAPDDADGRTVEWHVARFAEFLDAGDARPFALLVNFRDSHFPFPDDGAPTGWNGAREAPHDPAAVRVPPFLADLPEVRAEMAAYYDGLRRMDTTVGALLEVLATRGLEPDTLVLFTSDNGMPFPRAKTTLYEAGIHMPLLARWPGVVAPGRTADELVSLVDVLPTLLDLAGRTGGDFDGRSLAPLMRAEPVAWRDAVFGVHTTHRVEPAVPARSVRVGDWKYVRNFRAGERFENAVMLTSATWAAMQHAAEDDPGLALRMEAYARRPPEELYDLAADPYELRDLARDPEHATRRGALRARLRGFLEQQADPLLAEWE
jgi:N-sulfoglucosamine sulfohydrolase